LAEAAHAARDKDGVVRLHFTVAMDHRPAFEERLSEVKKLLESCCEATFDVSFSTQDPTTDTVALDVNGKLVRNEQGALLLRPGGHGALLSNLERCGGDFVLIKNIDNIASERHRARIVAWRLALVGTLIEAERRVGSPERPLRVCGMVPNEGQPGGGPFRVHSESFAGPQIVEQSEIDPADSAQQTILSASKHFNPVDMVVSLRGPGGEAWKLDRFVDRERRLVSAKTWRGERIRTLEQPGLWNGGMAGWNTLFVELPRDAFHPVKRLEDLLSVGHRS
jgi:hypothetical protein